MDKRTTVIQIIPAIIASGLILSAINSIYYLFYQPKISIDIVPNIKDENQNTINIKNNGQKSATNLLLTLEAPSFIKNSSVFYTENITISNSSKLNPNTLQIYVPRLTQGDGSIIKIGMFTTTSSNQSSKFIVYATSDQGSMKWSVKETLSLQAQFFSFFSTYWTLILTIIGSIIALLFFIFLSLGHLHLKKAKNNLSKAIESIKKTGSPSYVVEDDIEAARAMAKESEEQDKKARRDFLIAKLFKFLELRTILKKNIFMRNNIIEDRKKLLNSLTFNPSVKSSDLLLVEDYLSALDLRNFHIFVSPVKDDDEFKEYNKNILSLLEQLLTKIDWISLANSELKNNKNDFNK